MGQPAKTISLLLDAAANPHGLRLELHQDGLQCHAARPADAPAADTTAVLTPEALLALLKQHGVRDGLHHDHIARFCKLAQLKQPVPLTLLAAGEAPGTGRDGRLELCARSSDGELHQEDASGRVNMHRVKVLDNVEEGQEIGRIIPPETGPAGTTVTGKIIPGILGKPLALKLGVGVRCDADSGTLFATVAGRIIADASSLSVSKDYVVSGDVDFAVGNIDFNGFVEVSGDVLDGFDIRATGGIKIAGNVGACFLDSDGDVQLGGMSGQGKGRVRCAGSLSARYLNEATVECQGNVQVQNEIRNSLVKARGQILIPEGMVIGGECIALGGIEVRRTGTPGGVRTRLVAGVDFTLLDRKNGLLKQLREIDHEMAHIFHLVGSMRQRLGDQAALPPNVARLLERHEGLQNTQAVVLGELESCEQQVADNANPKINVKDLLHEGTVISLDGVTEEFRLEQQGPVSILRDPRREALRSLSLSPLTVPASELGAAFADEEL